MSTDPGAQDGSIPLEAAAAADDDDAEAAPPASLEQISQEAKVRPAAIIEEWQQARAALLGG